MLYSSPFHPGSLSDKTFLVTGGYGFIGSHLVEYLLHWQAGKVIVIDNLSTGFAENLDAFKSNPALKIIQGDITDRLLVDEAMQEADYVLHQAALGSVPRSLETPLATNHANVTGFLTVLESARKANIKRFVYASSSSVYGDHPGLPKVEREIGRPLSPYAVTKLVNEYYAEVFWRNYGMEIIGLRYFNIFGPRQNPSGPYAAAIPLFMDALLNDKPAFINGDGEQSRDFTFITNAVQANIKALFCPFDAELPQVYNVAISGCISINNLFNELKKIAGSSLTPLHRAPRPGDVRNSMADISRASSNLGYKPQASVEEGLKITFEWFKRHFS